MVKEGNMIIATQVYHTYYHRYPSLPYILSSLLDATTFTTAATESYKQGGLPKGYSVSVVYIALCCCPFFADVATRQGF